MIDFSCPHCLAVFSVPDHLAGRRARCKKCHTLVTVPEAAPRLVLVEPPLPGAPAAAAAAAAGPRLPPRTRRLKADAEQIRHAFENFPLIKARAVGPDGHAAAGAAGAADDPPDVYEVDYYVRGLERAPGHSEPVERNHHRAEIRLGLDYPRLGPRCRMLTPIFHPNIEPATICVGDHWAAGERLVDLVIRIGEMITYQAYNVKSPLDGAAAMWADLNAQRLPLDTRSLRPPELD